MCAEDTCTLLQRWLIVHRFAISPATEATKSLLFIFLVSSSNSILQYLCHKQLIDDLGEGLPLKIPQALNPDGCLDTVVILDMRQSALAIVTIHDACPAFSKKIFTFTDKLESLRIHYNIALVPFFNETQDLPRFPNFINQIKNCKGEIALHGLYHEKRNGQIDDFHTRSIATVEVEIRAGLEIFQEVGISNATVFVP
ncbi:MAG: DUF2334 domain-containing protein, partial [Thermoproteota archaeon]|nr:DUF2334 domain-containing protein [Thermoproteota archaeon]